MPFTIRAVGVDGGSELPQLRHEPAQWEWKHNTRRPNQVLGYLTPVNFQQPWKRKQGQEVMFH